MVTYHPFLPHLSTILKDRHHLLKRSTTLQKIFPSFPRVSYRRPKNLRDILVHSDVNKRTVTPGNIKCQFQGCKTCSIITTSDTFTSNTTKKTYKIKGSYNCKTSNMIYLIQCTKCGMQYVGETGQCLHQRMNNHRADVTSKQLEGKPVGRHDKPQHSVEDMKVTIIDYLGLKDDLSRKCRESEWIRKLVTFDPYQTYFSFSK